MSTDLVAIKTILTAHRHTEGVHIYAEQIQAAWAEYDGVCAYLSALERTLEEIVVGAWEDDTTVREVAKQMLDLLPRPHNGTNPDGA